MWANLVMCKPMHTPQIPVLRIIGLCEGIIQHFSIIESQEVLFIELHNVQLIYQSHRYKIKIKHIYEG